MNCLDQELNNSSIVVKTEISSTSVF